MKKSDLLQASAASSYEIKPPSQQPSQNTIANNPAQGFSSSGPQQQQTLGSSTESGVLGMDKNYGAQLNQLKIESQLSGSGAQQTSSFAKQLKIQQMYSDQASQAMQGHSAHNMSASTPIQGLHSVRQQTDGISWEIPVNATSVTAAHQILQSRQQQMSTLNNQVPSVFSARDTKLTKKHTGLNHFEKQSSNQIFQIQEAAAAEKGPDASNNVGTSYNQMRSRSPHNSNFQKWGQQSATQKGPVGANASGGSSLINKSLALKSHPISDSRRQHSNIGATPQGGPQVRGTAYQGSLWGGVNLLDSTTTQQRAAGKASGLTYTQNEHGNIVEQSNRDTWKSDWLQSDEKPNLGSSGQSHTQHSNIFSQAGKQRLKASYGARGDNWPEAVPLTTAQLNTEGRFVQIINSSANNTIFSQSRALNLSKEEVGQTFSVNTSTKGLSTIGASNEAHTLASGKFMASASQTSGQNLTASNNQVLESERGYSNKYRHTKDAQQPQPKLISNQPNQAAKRIQTRLNKGKQQLMQEGLQVMGFSRKPDQSLQTSQGSVNVAPLAEQEDLLEMTPEIGREKKQQRIMNANQTEAASSILKAQIPGKTHHTAFYIGSQDQAQALNTQEQKRQATEGLGHNRRAESLGKHQKLTSKLGSGKIEDPNVLQGLMHVQHWQQPKETIAAKKGKKSRHHNSFQGGMRPLKPYKGIQANSTNTSQLNDSGHASGGGKVPVSSLPVTHGGESNKIQVQNQSATIGSDVGGIASHKISSRRQPGPSTHNKLMLHPDLAPNNKLRLLPASQLSPAPNRGKPAFDGAAQIQQNQQPVQAHLEMSEKSSAQNRMKLLHQEFKERQADNHLAPPMSPKSIQRTPISSRKKSKKSKLVLDCDTLSSQQNPKGGLIKTERFPIQQEQVGAAAQQEGFQIKKESLKHRELKRIRHQNKLLSNPISSFSSQEREPEPCQSTEEEDDEMFARDIPKPGAHQLQMLQKQINSSRDSDSDETLSREEGPAVNNAMEILEQVTPSGVATSSAHKQDSASGQNLVLSTPQQKQAPREFVLEDEKANKVEEKNLNLKERYDKPNTLNGKESINSCIEEKKQIQPIQSRVRLSMEQRGSESISKKLSSSDSSFKHAFEQIIQESSGLKMQYEEILRSRLTLSDPVYSEFVDKILAKNRERQSKIFANSMPPQLRRKEDFQENIFTSKRVVQHIETQKKRHSEKIYRPFHSDMSRSHLLSNSLREDHPSITSPNLSGTAGASHLRRMQLHFNRHERKRRLHRYLSFNNGVTYHKSAQQASVLLPELSSGVYRNSFGHFGGRVFGISDSMSQRVQRVANDSSSSQKVTPIQQENKKLEDLKDATNRVKIVPPPQVNSKSLVNSPAADGVTKPQLTAVAAAGPAPSNLQLIYEKLNVNDRKAQQMKAFLPIMKKQHLQLAQENNFFKSDATGAQIDATLPDVQDEAPAASKQIYGKVIEWQMGKTLGIGTTGEVYEALNIDTGETFAVKMIKLMHPYLGLDQQKVKAVKKEIQRYKQLKHKHIVKYYDSEIIENNVLCIYLEYVYKSVAQMCREYGQIGEKNARMYTQQVLRALVYLHENNFIHGDLKGANVLVSQDGKEIKLCDMGNSLLLKQPQQVQDLSASLNSVSSLVYSSPAWMAPETHVQKVGKRSDIWSLGCLVIEMLTGQNPWGVRLEGESNVHMALQRKLANHERPNIPESVSPECRNFIDRCLQHDVMQRPQALDLLEDPWIRNKEHSIYMKMPPRHSE